VRRFQFTLERVLKLKEQRERVAELRQKQAHAALEMARRVVASIWSQLEQNARALEIKVGNAVPPGTWIAHYQHAAQLGQSLELADANLQRAAQELRDASAQRVQITKEVEALRHLRHQQWQNHWDETMRQEQIRLDELGMRRWKAAVPE
jgi:flagellar FliJ protein